MRLETLDEPPRPMIAEREVHLNPVLRVGKDIGGDVIDRAPRRVIPEGETPKGGRDFFLRETSITRD